MGNTDEPHVVKADPKDWFKKSKRPPTLDPKWNECKAIDRGSTGRTYTTSLTKTKAAKYDLQGIKDMELHIGDKRQTFYRHASNRVSKHDVYSSKRFLAMTNVKVNVWYGYGHLEEIEVQRSDQQLYKFMEGDFPRLHLNDIKDMLILVVQNRLFNLKGEGIVVTLVLFVFRIF
ncbi:hypothetical protein Tco_1076021 [Tanacetum coccineum]